MKKYETLISFTYNAETPQDAAKQFIENIIAIPDWYVEVKDIGTGAKFTVDTANYSVEAKSE